MKIAINDNYQRMSYYEANGFHHKAAYCDIFGTKSMRRLLQLFARGCDEQINAKLSKDIRLFLLSYSLIGGQKKCGFSIFNYTCAIEISLEELDNNLIYLDIIILNA